MPTGSALLDVHPLRTMSAASLLLATQQCRALTERAVAEPRSTRSGMLRLSAAARLTAGRWAAAASSLRLKPAAVSTARVRCLSSYPSPIPASAQLPTSISPTSSGAATGSLPSSSSSSLPAYLLIAAVSLGIGVMLAPEVSRLTAPMRQLQELKARGSGLSTLLSTAFPPPSLPSDAPDWLRALAADAAWQYKDVSKVFPVQSHLLYSALNRDDAVRCFYHFVQSAQPQPATDRAAAAAASTAPPPPSLSVVFYLGPSLCGHTGIVHGGLTASLIDQISGETAFMLSGPGAFTANLNVNYTKPLIADSWVRVHGRVAKAEGRKVWVDVTVSDGREGGEQYANGSVLFVRPRWLPQSESQHWSINASRVLTEEEKLKEGTEEGKSLLRSA